MNGSAITEKFLTGLVFGFDVGLHSIAYAVRRGDKFLPSGIGVLICENEGRDLSKRRITRRQRRTLRSRKYRRQWFGKELEKLGLLKPKRPLHDPIQLRLEALNGSELSPEELYVALAHLFKSRGYSVVPWASVYGEPIETANLKRAAEEGEIKKAVTEIGKQLAGKHPCQLLLERRAGGGKSPTEPWVRRIHWPREALRDEFLAILEAQKARFPKLSENANWLLYGETQSKKRQGKHYNVFFKTSETPNPGILGVRWPRFDNRSPGLDRWQPFDKQARPSHVTRKTSDSFVKAQWELALMGLRVLDANTRQSLDPSVLFPDFVATVRDEWNKKGKVSETRLKKLAEPFRDKFLLREDQKPLAPQTGEGRGRYSSATLEFIRREITNGRPVEPPPPVLQRPGESAEAASNRYMSGITHPVVRQRLILFRRVLTELISRFGKPDMIVMEAVRSLALSQKRRAHLNKRQEQFRSQRERALRDLSSHGETLSRKALQRYLLWKEARERCPFLPSGHRTKRLRKWRRN